MSLKNFKELPLALSEVSEPLGKTGNNYYYIQQCVDCFTPLRKRKDRLSLEPKCRSCNSKSHGLRYTKSYSMWRGIKNRCYNTQAAKFHRYGARGITVCKDWLDAEVFNNWYLDNKGKLEDSETSIHRVNNDGIYEPTNCVIITVAEHNRIHGILNRRVPTEEELKDFIKLRTTKGFEYLKDYFKCGQAFIYLMKEVVDEDSSISTSD